MLSFCIFCCDKELHGLFYDCSGGHARICSLQASFIVFKLMLIQIYFKAIDSAAVAQEVEQVMY